MTNDWFQLQDPEKILHVEGESGYAFSLLSIPLKKFKKYWLLILIYISTSPSGHLPLTLFTYLILGYKNCEGEDEHYSLLAGGQSRVRREPIEMHADAIDGEIDNSDLL